MVCYRAQHKVDGNTRWEEDAQADIKLCILQASNMGFSFVLFVWDLRVGFMGTHWSLKPFSEIYNCLCMYSSIS